MNNNKPIIHNLDEKQNPPEYIRLGGIDMDISFIPCGVAIPLTKAYEEWREHYNKHGIDNIRKNNDIAQENNLLIAKTVSVFTTYADEKINEDWLLKNLSVENLGFVFKKIMGAISGISTSNTNKQSEQTEDIVEDKKKELSDGNEQ